MSVEVHHADPKFRRIAPALLIAVLLLGGGAVWALQRWLAASRSPGAGDDLDGMLFLAVGLVVVMATVSLGLAHSLWQEATRIRREDRFPPSDMRTMRDVPIVHGAAARRYAAFMRAGAAVALVAGLGILVWGYRLLRLVT